MVSAAPSKFASVSGEGVAARAGRAGAETWNVRGFRSPSARFALASRAVTATVCAPFVKVVGLPQTSRDSVPGQLPAPSASNTSLAGRPEAVQVTAPLPPVAAGAWNSATGAVAVKALGGDGGAGGVSATGPDHLPAARAGGQGSWRHTASSAIKTFFAFLSARPMASVTPPSSPRRGASANVPDTIFTKDAAPPTKAFFGRSQAP